MTIAAVPADYFVSSLPSVLAAGGNSPGMNGIFGDNSGDTSIPIGTVPSFANQAAVAAWYGPSSLQATLATYYFNSFIGATRIPSALSFFQYNTTAVSGYMRGGTVAGLSLAQLQALSGTITVSIDGVSHTSANINLAGATSFTNAATLMQTGLQSGTPSTTATVTYDALRQAFVITSSTTGTSSSVLYGTDSSLSPSLNFTAATGAVLSPGAVAQTPAGAMAMVISQTQNWAGFSTTVDPDDGAAGGPQKLLFSAWTNGQDGAYAYVGYDSDPTPANSSDDSACYAQQVTTAQYNGTIPVWAPTGAAGAQKAAFILGAIASINFGQTSGRVAFGYLSQSGLTPDVANLTTLENLQGNGYNSYCVAATKQQQFNFLWKGTTPGQWGTIDRYINQLYWNAEFQNDLMVYRTTVKWIPYTSAGYGGIRQAMQSDITAMGAFGAWVSGATLTSQQIAEVNAEAGINIATTLQNQGWYLQISDPSSSVMDEGGSPEITYWYTDGGNVLQLAVNAIDVES
jgi:Protein of unknown function (DUF3383)